MPRVSPMLEGTQGGVPREYILYMKPWHLPRTLPCHAMLCCSSTVTDRLVTHEWTILSCVRHASGRLHKSIARALEKASQQLHDDT